MLAEIVLVLLCICFAIYLSFCGIAYFRYAFGRTKTQDLNWQLPPASIIICARNEAENLKKHLHYVLDQNYHAFEVIVIDDETVNVAAVVFTVAHELDTTQRY